MKPLHLAFNVAFVFAVSFSSSLHSQTVVGEVSDLAFPCEQSPEACAKCRSDLAAIGTPVELLESQCGVAESSAAATEYSGIDFSALVGQVTGIECDTYYDRFDVLLSEESGTDDDRNFAHVEGICYQLPLSLFRQDVIDGSDDIPYHPNVPVVLDTIDFANGLVAETTKLRGVIAAEDICVDPGEEEESGTFDFDELQSRKDAVQPLLDCARWYELAVQCDFPSLKPLVEFEGSDFSQYDLSDENAVLEQFPDERPAVVLSLIAYAQWREWWHVQQGSLREQIESLGEMNRKITRDRRALCEQ